MGKIQFQTSPEEVKFFKKMIFENKT